MNTDKEKFIKDVFIKDISKLDSHGSHIKKADIIKIAESYGIDFKPREGKEAIVSKIIKAGFFEKLFDELKEFIYIPNWVVGRFFGFNGGEEIDQLKNIGVIREDSVKESFYSRDSKREVYYNAYPLSILNYNVEELKKAYDLAFNQLDFKIRVETKTNEEVKQIEEALEKIFIIHNNPLPYEGRKEGYRTYYNVSLLNNSEQESNKFLYEIQKLKNEFNNFKEYHNEEVKRINDKWCKAVGVDNFMQAKSNKNLIEYYENKIKSLEEQLQDKKHNNRGAGRKLKFTDQQKKLILQDRENGLTMKQLSIKYNCSAGTIHKLIHEHIK